MSIEQIARSMKNKKIRIIIFLAVLVFASFFLIRSKLPNSKTTNRSIPTNYNNSKLKVGHQLQPTPIKSGHASTSLYFPYWTLPDSFNLIAPPEFNNGTIKQFSNFIYFGIAANENGIDKNELGYSALTNKYLPAIKQLNNLAIKQYLTLRMTNSDVNFKILEDWKLQHKIRDEAIKIAKENGFDGIVLDLEVSALPTENLKQEMNMFITDFSVAVKSENMNFMMTVYGDNFYRARPYDLASLTTYTDQFLIMMYDLHKAAGEPGPNFPLSKGNQFDYDLKAATDSFLRVLPPEKITVVFGLFGYDWSLGPEGKPLKPANPLTLNKIKLWFLGEKCQYKNCINIRDNDSKETKITYVDNENQNHVIWFENEESIAKKIEFLKTKGITNFSFWAYGYY